jgi:hypothetical protein
MSETRVCRECHQLLPLGAFKKMRRGHSRTCEACIKDPIPAAEAGPTAGERELIMPPGFGFHACLTDDQLQILQIDAAGKTDHVMLSRTEAKVLFAEFYDWMNA